jgi:hypothetical protein
MNISPVPMTRLQELLPMPMMFLYGCLRQGQIEVDRENQLIKISEVAYDVNMLDVYIQRLDQTEAQYIADLEANGLELSTNEMQVFNSIREIYSEIKAFI